MVTNTTIQIYGNQQDTDTYITSAPSGNVRVFDGLVGNFINLPIGEDSEESLIRSRQYTKCGFSGETESRSVFLFHPLNSIKQQIGNSNFGIERAFFEISAIEAVEGALYEALLLPASANADESMTWNQSSQAKSSYWSASGGDYVTPLSGKTPTASVVGGKLRFDVSQYATIWEISGKTQLGLVIRSLDPSVSEAKFYSWENETSFLGNSVTKNCRFLSEGDQNSIHSEGILVDMTGLSGSVVINLSDSRSTAVQNFSSFQYSVPVGATFDFHDYDTNNSISIGTKTCTLIGRSDLNSFELSGFTLPNGATAHQSAIELSAETTVPYGSNILQLDQPSAQQKSESLALQANQKLKIRYFSDTANNNSRDFTVSFASDETRHKNRIRIYLNEYTVSENRNGMDTEISESENKPSLILHLNVLD